MMDPRVLPERAPEVGEMVLVRSRRWLVDEVVQNQPGESALVPHACADDDAKRQIYWDCELDHRILEEEGRHDLASRASMSRGSSRPSCTRCS